MSAENIQKATLLRGIYACVKTERKARDECRNVDRFACIAGKLPKLPRILKAVAICSHSS